MQAGFHIACMKKIVRGRTEIGDLFLGFNFFVPALIAALVIAVFCFAGVLLCIIPALVIAAMYQFTYLFIVDRRMDFWPAMQASHAVVKNDYFGFVLFLRAGLAEFRRVSLPLRWFADNDSGVHHGRHNRLSGACRL